MNQKTAILFFARSPESEAKAKHWTKSHKQNISIAKALYNNTFDSISGLSIPIICSNEQNQTGKNFNQKIVNALYELFLEGYDNAVVVGSDCVSFEQKDVLKAIQNIQNGQNTIGETQDGGVYLFSVSKEQFDNAAFETLPWCSETLNYALNSFLSNRSISEISILEKKIDLDYHLSPIIPYFIFVSKALKSAILSAISFCRVIVIKKIFHYHSYLCENSKFRGPPITISFSI